MFVNVLHVLPENMKSRTKGIGINFYRLFTCWKFNTNNLFIFVLFYILTPHGSSFRWEFYFLGLVSLSFYVVIVIIFVQIYYLVSFTHLNFSWLSTKLLLIKKRNNDGLSVRLLEEFLPLSTQHLLTHFSVQINNSRSHGTSNGSSTSHTSLKI